jgi:hypothetical protein
MLGLIGRGKGVVIAEQDHEDNYTTGVVNNRVREYR